MREPRHSGQRLGFESFRVSNVNRHERQRAGSTSTT